MSKEKEQKKCRITNIQKYSIHDGDGIRTTVFFKGCPLRCVWCHNPETQSKGRELLFDREKCTGCGVCSAACPQQAIAIENGTAETDRKQCITCGTCTEVCVRDIREIAGGEYTVEELVEELLKDQMFYEQSGGGVTFSGGEVLAADRAFVLEAAKELNRQGISLAIDTCGYAPYERLRELLPYTDFFLYDVKVMDEELHKKYTGTDNRLILDNLIRLSRDGAKIYIRIPAVKGVSATKQNIKDTAAFLKENNIRPAKIHLLAYHNTGSGKYRKLDQDYPGAELRAPDQEELDALADIFVKAGFCNIKTGG